MRAMIDGTSLTVDTIMDNDGVTRVVDLAFRAGLHNVTTGPDDTPGPGRFMVHIRPPRNFADHGLPAMLSVVAGVYGKSPEQIIDEWRARTGEAAPVA